jgi:beta-mannanase
MMKSTWGSRPGQFYIRFAHEMNGTWYPWAVRSGDVENFKTSWRRYRALQQEIFPQAKLVFSPNRESVGVGVDWRTMFPGAGQVDVMGLSYYNQYPHVTNEAEWQASLNQTDQWALPRVWLSTWLSPAARGSRWP